MKKREWESNGTMAQAQRNVICQALEEHDYKITHVASALQIGRTSVYRYIAEFDIDVSEMRRGAHGQDSPSTIAKSISTIKDCTHDRTHFKPTMSEILKKTSKFSYGRLAKGLVQAFNKVESLEDKGWLKTSDLLVLLHIYASEYENTSVNISSIAWNANLNAVTAKKRLQALSKLNLVKFNFNHLNKPRYIINMTSKGRKQVETYLTGII